MARMHSRDKGKSGSTKPMEKETPDWVDYKPEEVIELVIGLANEGQKKSLIGITLRDQHGIPSVKTITDKTITQILEENDLKEELPEDLLNLIRKSVSLQNHLKENKKDTTAKRGYQLTVSKIRRLTKYYSKKNRIPKGWRYTEETARFLVK